MGKSQRVTVAKLIRSFSWGSVPFFNGAEWQGLLLFGFRGLTSITVANMGWVSIPHIDIYDPLRLQLVPLLTQRRRWGQQQRLPPARLILLMSGIGFMVRLSLSIIIKQNYAP